MFSLNGTRSYTSLQPCPALILVSLSHLHVTQSGQVFGSEFVFSECQRSRPLLLGSGNTAVVSLPLVHMGHGAPALKMCLPAWPMMCRAQPDLHPCLPLEKLEAATSTAQPFADTGRDQSCHCWAIELEKPSLPPPARFAQQRGLCIPAVPGGLWGARGSAPMLPELCGRFCAVMVSTAVPGCPDMLLGAPQSPGDMCGF